MPGMGTRGGVNRASERDRASRGLGGGGRGGVGGGSPGMGSRGGVNRAAERARAERGLSGMGLGGNRGGISGALSGVNSWLERNAPYTSYGAALSPAIGPLGIVGGGLIDAFNAIRGGSLDFGGLGDPGRASGGVLGPKGDRGGGFPDPRRGLPAPGGLAATLAKRWARPNPLTAPNWMRFDPVMTDLQRRSYIATEGLSGNQGLYRSDEAKNYYANLLGRTLIGPTGELGDFNTLLPIEQQYLQALGISGHTDTAGLLTKLGLKPGQGTFGNDQRLIRRDSQRMLGSGPMDGTLPAGSSLRSLLAGNY
jgi:hypothetical protein